MNVALSVSSVAMAGSLLGLTVVAVYVPLRIKNNRLLFTGQYYPQYDKEKASNNYEHLWQFIVVNNTNKRIDSFELCLPSKVDRADVMQVGQDLTSFTKTNTIEIEKLRPNGKVTFRVWNMGAGSGTGEDVYIVKKGKTIRPKILETLDN